jgi:hypothetical protein
MKHATMFYQTGQPHLELASSGESSSSSASFVGSLRAANDSFVSIDQASLGGAWPGSPG